MIPNALKPFAQFVNHNNLKQPVDALTGQTIDQHNPLNHLTATEAYQRASTHGLSVAFVLTTNDPFFFLDIDHCITTDGQWSELSASLYQYFQGCYFEISASQTGAHIIGTLSTRPEHACKNILSDIELYTELRSVTLTGYQAQGDAATNADQQVQWLIENYFPPNPNTSVVDWTDTPCPEWNGILDDNILIEKMLKSKSASSVFGGTASFADLWNRNVDVLSVQYPHETNDFDLSSADAALISHLAFWTGRNCARIERLFYFSGLIRDKWTAREDYRRRTILNACSRCQAVYGQGVEAAPPVNNTESSVNYANVKSRQPVFQFLPVDQQPVFFQGCCYIKDCNRILTPNGMKLDQSRFNATYGGYVFALDSIGDKTTPDAWKVFTNSQALDFPKVDHTGFHPTKASGAVVTDDIGRTEVNTYIPSAVASTPGNVDRFTTHLAKLIPDQNDRDIIIAYMAATVQYVGKKFYWCPLIQGTEGNGKSLIASCMREAVGKRYTHDPRAKEIGEKYNSWMENMLLVIIEEINVAGKFELMDVLKTLITAEYLEIRAMNTDQRMASVCANFIMFSNFKDAVIKTTDNRRNAIFYTAQQKKTDITRDGMDGKYFPEIYEWLRSGGYANVTYFLQNYPIPSHLNPATECHRAPRTTSTDEAINYSRSKAERAIISAIDEERVGFLGGWISSMQISKLLSEKRINDASNHRKQMLDSLGYVTHPGLPKGRSFGRNIIDGGRSTLYVTVNHPTITLTDGKLIVAEYLRAQGHEAPV